MILLANGEIINDGHRFTGTVAIGDDGCIAAVDRGTLDASAVDTAAHRVIDLRGRLVMPGVIDEHVHFRDPGLTEKGDIATESLAAVAGGVTTYFDMPNTRPATVDMATWEAKMARAAEVSRANYAFFPGVTDSNLGELMDFDPRRIPGVKLFMGASTGGMCTDSPEALRRLFATYRGVIAVHAEDGRVMEANLAMLTERYPGGIPAVCHRDVRDRRACVAATEKAVRLARECDARLHVMHISTADELRFFSPGEVEAKTITAETCPHYLIFADLEPDDEAVNLTKCNPAIKTATDRQALLRAIGDGIIDTVATDHAPHLLAQKQGDALTAASGMPSVQFSLPLMLEQAAQGAFDIHTVVRVMCHAPAGLWRIDRRGYLRRGYHADIAVVNPSAPHTITDADVVSRCGWTPYRGHTTRFAIEQTWVNGHLAFSAGEKNTPGVDHHAQPVCFNN